MPGAGVYSPRVFEAVSSIEHAKAVILTEEDQTTARRWRVETPWLVDLAFRKLGITAGSTVLDYGCGIGRLAKGLVNKFGCRVIGVDISANMRALATHYVGSAKFEAISPEELPGRQFDAALAVWVLQHCPEPETDIAAIDRATQGPVLVVNTKHRAVPGEDGDWFDDGIDVAGLLARRFRTLDTGMLPEHVSPPYIARHTYWRVCAR